MQCPGALSHPNPKRKKLYSKNFLHSPPRKLYPKTVLYFGMMAALTYYLCSPYYLRVLEKFLILSRKNPSALSNPKLKKNPPKTKKLYPRNISYSFHKKSFFLYFGMNADQAQNKKAFSYPKITAD